jgi:hypothetical protein
VIPLKGVSDIEVEGAVAAGTTIQLWTYSVSSSRNGNNYSGYMVGASPLSAPGSTTSIPTQIVPLIIEMPDGGIFDPTALDFCASPLGGPSDLTLIQQSPILLSHAYTMNGANVGVTQYVDAFQRANFWSLIGGQAYHVLLSPITLNPIIITVPPGLGVTVPPSQTDGCRNLGLLDLASFDRFVQNTLIPALAGQGVNPTTFPIFVLSNVLECFGGCGIEGYHGVVPSTLQTYSVSDFDTVFGSDIAVLSHEVAEWLDDPFGTNSTPLWGRTGQVRAGCQANLEVGDPLTGTNFPLVTMPNGYAYHIQELAFFSWFFGGPSLGAGGLFSNNGSFSQNSRVCAAKDDFDGDGRTDLAVWRPSSGGWFIRYSSQGYSTATYSYFQWGLPGDTPLIGDFDGDGKTDLAVWRPSIGGWFVRYSSQGYSAASYSYHQWGLPGDVPMAMDFDGDGKTDLAVWRPAIGGWFIRYSSQGYSKYSYYQWGLRGDEIASP